MTRERALIGRFLAIPFRRQVAIARELNLLEDGDLDISDDRLSRAIFERAVEAGITEQLFAAIGAS